MNLYARFREFLATKGESWASTDKIDNDEVLRRVAIYKNWKENNLTATH